MKSWFHLSSVTLGQILTDKGGALFESGSGVSQLQGGAAQCPTDRPV